MPLAPLAKPFKDIWELREHADEFLKNSGGFVPKAGGLSGDKRGRVDADISPYAAPARAEDLRGLPPTYIDVGALDLLRDGVITFVGKLAAADVQVSFHLFDGMPHAWDGMPTDTGIIARNLRLKAIKSVNES